MPNDPKSPSQPLAGPLESGTVLQGRYAIAKLLGGGGMGVVYLARDQRLANRPCAIKEMVDHFIDPQQRIEANEYFAREADTLAQLKHQAIPAITDRFEIQNRHYLVMEYVEGRNLEEELAARGEPLPEGLVIDVARQLSDVLAYLHGLQPPIIYRDMKPSNVMLNPNGRVVLVDFGIARLFKAARKGTMIGTLGFAPPEQYQGQVDPRSDIYSLGATLHYVLTGRDPEKYPPFSFPPVRDLRPAVSSNLAGAIDAALAYEMNGRPSSIQEFRDMMLYGRGLSHTGARGVSSTDGTGGLTLPPEPDFDDRRYDDLPIVHRKPRSALRRTIGLMVFLIVLGGGAFGATYLYSSTELQIRLGVKPLIDSLPWKHEQLVSRARENPLEFQQMTLALSTREGTVVAPPQSTFKDTELTNARYLKWTASFKNLLAGLDGSEQKVEARFFDPAGLQIASSGAQQFVGPSQTIADFSGVALMPTMTEKPPGNYKVALYSDDRLLAQQAFIVSQDTSAKTAAAAAEAAVAAAAKAEEKRRVDESRKLAMIEQRRLKPLELRNIEFLNTTKTGTAISGATTEFDASKVLFVGWQATFDNRLYKLEANQYRVDAAYIGADGRTLGSVNDFQPVSPSMKTVTFSGRVGNSRGGAFLPGTYTVNFYLNGQYFSEKKFRVVADAGGPYASYPGSGGAIGRSTGGSSSSGSSSSGSGSSSMLGPTLATGTISGLRRGGSPALELRLRPQPNGFLHGEMVIKSSGYGLTPIEGFVRGSHLQFQVPYGTETYYFEGQRRSDELSGTFESTPSGERGTWTAQAN
ncbi:MAG: protein kinase [Candidatus Binatus sp.]|uniref:protein kinase domain-containing protein n=1 Tax=Candidatus Binatus sp. TaxID=2811406 RepID=UPI0027215F26|nr:protein kinase [Candidatus Binatus sp.]MDO8432570.1 protein kinase [Candidatus Binatus sp.]